MFVADGLKAVRLAPGLQVYVTTKTRRLWHAYVAGRPTAADVSLK